MSAQSNQVPAVHLLAHLGLLDRLTPTDVIVLTTCPDFWRPGPTPTESLARNDLAEAIAALDRGDPEAASAAIERARSGLATAALLCGARGS
jgi:hypothetical protein